jgi:hypothetical protein
LAITIQGRGYPLLVEPTDTLIKVSLNGTELFSIPSSAKSAGGSATVGAQTTSANAFLELQHGGTTYRIPMFKTVTTS